MPTYYGASVDTWVALGSSDAGPYHTERRDHAPTGPNVYEALGLSPRLRVSFRPASPSPSAIRISTDAPQHVRHGSTPQTAHGSLNPHPF